MSRPREPRELLVVRPGVGANCSSIGSAIDVVFAAATVGTALFAAVAAALRDADDDGGNGGGTGARAEGDHRERSDGWRRVTSPPSLVRWAPAGAPSPPPRERTPLEVHLAVTSRCGAGCVGCYMDARPDGEEPTKDELLARLDAIAESGAFVVAFGGGEPTTRADLGELALAARARGLVPVLTTSGLGLTPRKLERLTAFSQVNVSYDGPGELYAGVRGFAGAQEAEHAIEGLVAAGVRVGVNVVLTRRTFPHLAAVVLRARALGAHEAQLLRYKPAGRATELTYLDQRLTAEQARSLGPRLRELAAELGGAFGLRIDCALVPFLSADEELYTTATTLERFGVFGCEAGRHLRATTVSGASAPCSFAPLSAVPFDGDTARGVSERPAEPCASCALRTVCRGGCRVVSGFLTGRPSAPDPECPRVRAARAAAGPSEVRL